MDTLREPLLVLDSSLKVQMASRNFYRMFYVVPEETEGCLLYDLGNGQWDITRLRELLETVISENTTIEDFEVEHDFPVIGRKMMILNARKIDRPADFPLTFLLAIEDVTTRRLAEKAMIEQARLREEIEHITQHDLKGPLTSIIGLPDLLLEDDNINLHQRKLINYIQKSGYRMLEQINRSLDLYRMEQGSYTLEFQPVALLPIFRQIKQEFETMCHQRDILIRITSDRDVSILGEKLLVISLFSNLVKNALEAGPTGSQVTINLSCKERIVAVRIHNHGQIPEEIRDRFFDKFITSGKYGGTGLGTYAARLIAEIQGGKISVEIPAEGEVLVTVFLPAL